MPKRTNDDIVKPAATAAPAAAAPVSAFAARRQRQAQQQQQQIIQRTEAENDKDIHRNNGTSAQRPGNETEPEYISGYSSGKEETDPTTDNNLIALDNEFSPNDSNYLRERNELTVSLSPGESLAFQGQFKLKVQSGIVDIAGARIKPSQEVVVVAPSTHSLPRIDYHMGSQQNEFSATMIITSYESGLSEVGKIIPMFKNILSPVGDTSKVKTTFTPVWKLPKQPTILELTEWRSILDTISESFLDSLVAKAQSPVILVTGSKSTGKSTFCRALANSLITSETFSSSLEKAFHKVCFLDIDPGQPTFTPPCILSLRALEEPVLAPPFACVAFDSAWQRAHHIGYTSPRDDPEYFIACTLDLLEYYYTNYSQQGIPLIINTPGWTKGMGREILQRIVQRGGITDIVALGHPDEVEGLLADMAPSENGVSRSHIVAPTPHSLSRIKRYTAADLRALQTVCYFHRCLQNAERSSEAKIFDFSTHLTLQVPWVGSYSPQPNAAISAISILDAEVEESLLVQSILGTIVSIELMKKDDATQHPLISMASKTSNTSSSTAIPYVSSAENGLTTFDLLPPSATETAGLALLRNIDMQSGEIYFLMPISDEQLETWDAEGYQVAVVRGRAETPLWLLWQAEDSHKIASRGEHDDEKEYVTPHELPYLSFDNGRTSKIKGGKEWRVRKNLMRRSQARTTGQG